MNDVYQTAVEWDVVTWSWALRFWEKVMLQKELQHSSGLEIGARNGGISWFFARQFGCSVCCTDYEGPSELAHQLHAESGLGHLISHATADATTLPFPDETFDFVVFKSVLGVVGSHNRMERVEQAIQEMQRVLKPGGVLFFAENLQGSTLHRFARRWFVSWGKNWRYLRLAELDALLSGFGQKELHSTGFSAAFVPKPAWLKGCFAHIDSLLFFIPKSWRYVAYGYAVKRGDT